jgi:hypothetical protein
METTSDKTKETGARPASTDQRPGGNQQTGAAGAATELGRHYGEHGQPATTSAGPAPQDAARGGGQTSPATAGGTDVASRAAEQARSAVADGTEAMRDLANRATEQASSAAAVATETARDIANRASEQVAPAAEAVYDQSARAGRYMTRNIQEYPATALLIAAAIGYGLAYLMHGGGRSLR